jgi:Spy/CpxP family protein refolding chaperone
MTKKMFILSAATLALLLTASLAVAQPGAGRGGAQPGGRGQVPAGPGGRLGDGPGFGGGLAVLFNEEARKDLEITDAQATKLREASEKLRGQFQPPQEGQRPDPAQFREQFQKIQQESRKNLESILSKDQVVKYDVLVFQQSGGLEGRFVTADSLRALNLTEDQQKKIQEINEKALAAVRPPEGFDFRNASQEERDKLRTAGEEARKKATEELKAVLTKEQIDKAAELTKSTPEYLQRRNPQGGAEGRGNEGRRGENLNNWQPGNGTTERNPNREERGNNNRRNGNGDSQPRRRVPGASATSTS